jgi:deazaflavin-dependent oxidoreductase (nitroreductase family)
MSETPNRYIEPDWFSAHILNPTTKWLAERGISLLGTRILEVRGRKSGEWRYTVVNLLERAGDTYLVAPRGSTQWVRNLRAAGAGQLRLGKKRNDFRATELTDVEKLPVLQEYLRRWGWEVGQFFEGVDRNATDDQLLEIAPGFPVFRIEIER